MSQTDEKQMNQVEGLSKALASITELEKKDALKEVELLIAGAQSRGAGAAGPAMIYTLEPCFGSYRATFVSESVLAHTGYAASEFSEDAGFWMKHIHPDDIGTVTGALSQLLEDGFTTSNYRFLLTDGTYRWMHDEMRLVRDRHGKTIEIVGCWTDASESKESEKDIRNGIEKLKRTMSGIVQAFGLAVEARDPYTAGHQQRVADLARALAGEMELPSEQIDGIGLAAGIHDLGKIQVPVEILAKPGGISDAEMTIIMTHSQKGYDILKAIDILWPLAQIVLQHHERMDGSGYPNGLMGEEIILGARILCVADVVEAMASQRPYRPALGVCAALEEISRNRDELYDPDVADVCLKLFCEKDYQLQTMVTA